MTPKLLLVLAAVALLGFGAWLATRIGSATDAPRAPAATCTPGSSAAPLPTPPLPTPPALAIPRRAKKPAGSPVEVEPDPAVARALADPDPKHRLGALETLIRDGDDPAAILAASRDRDAAVSARAMEALAPLYVDGRIPLAELTARHADRALADRSRRLALEAIAQVASPAGARYLAAVAGAGSLDDRRAVAMLLGAQRAADAVPALRELARDRDETVRVSAKASLARLGAPD